MKNFNFVIIFLLPLTIYCQNVATDTSYVISENGYFYLNHTIVYDDNSYVISKKIIGDTLDFYALSFRHLQNKINEYNVKVVNTNMFSKEITTVIRENENILQITGKSPIDTLGVRTYEFLSDDKFRWVINNTPVTFSITANKVLRYTVEGASIKTMFGFGKNMIRLTSYPTTGSFLDLYWDEGRKLYVSQDGKINLRRISAAR